MNDMREILFRGKRTDNGEWITGHYEFYNGKHYINVQTDRVNSGGYPIREFIEVIPETVGQYTGLTGKNGKKIFEGDIIKDCDYDHIHTVRYFGDEDYPAFDCQPELQFCECNGLSHLCAVSAMEVIGNIHDNPELLEGE